MSLAEELKARIAAEGPMPLDAWMETCNAHYYATRDPLGADGDFTTAPEISQMFGELVGAALVDCWIRAGAPEEAVYAELGPGRGTLAADALRVMRGAGFSGAAHLIETSPTLREAQAKAMPDATWHDDIDGLPKAPLLLVANEFFDALPIRQTIGEEERKIGHDGERFVFEPAGGEIVESSEAIARYVGGLAQHLIKYGGAALVIDYGYGRGETGDTLQALKAHEKVDPLAFPGDSDLTAHVDFAAVAKAARDEGAATTGMLSQGNWLETLGLGPRAMALAAKNPAQAEAIAAARQRLAGEDEMGQLFKVMAIHRPDWPAPAGLGA